MTSITRFKLGIAAAALVLFIVGVRQDVTALRWAAVALLLGAFLLRFYKPRA